MTRAAAWTLAALVLAIVVVALVRVPWSAPPAPRADQLAALADLPADKVAEGKRLRAELRPSGYTALLLGLAVALLLGLTPLGARLVGLFGTNWVIQAVAGGFAVVGVGELLTLPFAAWRHSIAVRYGLSTQDWGGWAVDVLKGYAIGAVLGAVVLLGFFGLTRLAPKTWWAWAAAAAAALTVVLTFVFPVLVEPVFNKFTPMEPGPLRDDLVAMAERDGVPVRDVLVADASRRTTTLNAYVSGLGPTRRIVVYDTLLREAPPAEVRAVVAHELGHAKFQDVFTGTALSALAAAAGVCVLYLLGAWTGLLRRAGVESIASPSAIALILAVTAVGSLLAAPLSNVVSRRLEARADRHALELTNDPTTVERMDGRLATTNLADVDPPRIEYFLYATHPSTVERIAAARAYARGER